MRLRLAAAVRSALYRDAVIGAVGRFVTYYLSIYRQPVAVEIFVRYFGVCHRTHVESVTGRLGQRKSRLHFGFAQVTHPLFKAEDPAKYPAQYPYQYQRHRYIRPHRLAGQYAHEQVEQQPQGGHHRHDCNCAEEVHRGVYKNGQHIVEVDHSAITARQYRYYTYGKTYAYHYDYGINHEHYKLTEYVHDTGHHTGYAIRSVASVAQTATKRPSDSVRRNRLPVQLELLARSYCNRHENPCH